MVWLDSISPNRPENLLAVQTNKSVLLSWKLPTKAKDGDAAYGFTIYRFEDNEPLDIDKASAIKKVFFGATTSWEDQDIIKGKKYTYVVTALDRLKNESEHAIPVTVSIK